MYRFLRTSAIFLVITLLMSQCKQEKKSEVLTLHQDIMAIHDNVMPKMSDIYRLKKSLKSMYETTKDPSYGDLILRLNQADDMMMDWMAQYKQPKSNTSDDIAYLKSEKNKIKIVSATMQATIQEAQKLIDEL